MNNSVALLMLLDSRNAESDEWCSQPDSIFAMPQKREELRRLAGNATVLGEVVVELANDTNLEFAIDSAVHQAFTIGASTVITLDRQSLDAAGIFNTLNSRLQDQGESSIVDCQPDCC
jgi:hypothetical protein